MDIDKEPSPGEVTLLIERYLALENRGVDISVSELCKSAPHLADSVAKAIQALRQFDRLLEDGSQQAGMGSERATPANLGKRNGTTDASCSYLIKRLHGYGGCSEVYLAEDAQLGRTVAIKFLRPDVEGIESFQRRLQREAEITSRLDHPGIVSIHAQGNDENGLPFYAMRFVDGQSLGSEIKSLHDTHQPVSNLQLRKLINHFIDVCQTVAFAHDRGVVHRDVKPENIITGNFGETYLIDWGLAKQLGLEDPSVNASIRNLAADETATNDLTQHGNTIGTPAFMSPEQAAGQNIGEASDVFNLGATLYCILTGRPPYRGDSLLNLVDDAKRVRFPAPEVLRPNLPKPLVAICHRAMARKPGDRYGSPLELADDLECFLADQSVSAYRDPIGETIRRWVITHRTLVTTVLTTCVATILILAVATGLLIQSNRELVKRESEATFHKNETRKALVEATESLYGQNIALAHSELTKNNVVRAEEILNECPIAFRSMEWHLLTFMIQQQKPLRTISTHGDIVRAFDFSPDGNTIAVGQSEGEIHVYRCVVNPVNGEREIEPLHQLHDGMEIWQIEISPDGNQLAVGGRTIHEGRVRGAMHVWDLNSQTLIKRRWGHGNLVQAVAWSGDGTRIATGGSVGGVRIRDAQTLEPVSRINDAHDAPIRSIKFLSGKNDQVVTAGEQGWIKRWCADGSLAAETRAHFGGVGCLEFSDELVFSAGNDNLIRQWNLSGSEIESTGLLLVGNTDHVETISVSPDKQFLASGGLDRNVRVWDVQSRELIATVQCHTSHVRKVEFDPTGRLLLTTGDDGGVNVWDTSKLLRKLPEGDQVQFSNVSNQLIATTSQQVSIWDAEKEQPVIREFQTESRVTTIACANQSDAFAVLHLDGTIDVRLDGRHVRLADCNSPIYSGVFSTDDTKIYVAHRNGQIHAWDVASEKVIGSAKTGLPIRSLGLTADQTLLIAGSQNGKLILLDARSLEPEREFEAHSKELLGMAVHPTLPKVATTGRDGMVKIWNSENGQLEDSLRFGASWLNCLAFSPDGERLVTGSEHTILFWDTEARKEVLSMSVDRCVHSISFGQTGRFMAVAGESPRIRVWQVGQ